jgi:hypothetical protein
MLELDGTQDTLNCKRCNGLVVPDKFICQFQWIEGIRCVNCGYVKLKEVLFNVSKTRYNNPNKSSELELYRTRSRRVKRCSNNLQY